MKIFILSVAMFVCSCASNNGIKINVNQRNHFLNLPAGCQQEEVKGEVYTETRFIYPDGSIFYYTDDNESGGSINHAKVNKYGEEILIKIAVSDTLDLIGEDNAEKYWREKKMGNIVLGYINADEHQKLAFDRVIADLR